jgi:signal transduction histidine kinase
MAAMTGWHQRLGSATARDAALVCALFAADVGTQAAVTAGARLHVPPLGPAAIALAGFGAAVFWVRRSRPILVFALVFCTIVLSSALAAPGLWTDHTGVPLAIAAYAIGSWSQSRIRTHVVPAVALLLTFGALAHAASVLTAGLAAVVVIALPWVAGRAARSRRQYLQQVERQLAEAERERDERARQAVLDERRHIARELHDVVAHHVSLIGVQAGAARTALDHEPHSTRLALLAIEESSRSAVGEMRRLLGVLDSGEPGGPVRGSSAGPGGPAGPGAARLEPLPGLGLLDELAGGFRRAGLEVDLRASGELTGLSPLLELCCYRLIEEALTNVTTHSAAATASVDLMVSEPQGPAGGHTVRISVRDPGPARTGTAGSGRGLVGMRERVALFGGTLAAGTAEDGGFTIGATLGEQGRG